MLIRGKIDRNCPDFICGMCPQEYKGVCRAFLIPHTEEEKRQRIEMPVALCKLIKKRELEYPWELLGYRKMYVYKSVFGTPKIELVSKYHLLVIVFSSDGEISHGLHYKAGGTKVLDSKACYELLDGYIEYLLHKLKYSGNYVVRLPDVLEKL